MRSAESWENTISAAAHLGAEGELIRKIKQVQKDALAEGLTRFAWWKDGTQYVGTCGTTLATALKEIETP